EVNSTESTREVNSTESVREVNSTEKEGHQLFEVVRIVIKVDIHNSDNHLNRCPFDLFFHPWLSLSLRYFQSK
ncbi:MAG: hypothetical protein ACK55Z_20905, partial [bacterium]